MIADAPHAEARRLHRRRHHCHRCQKTRLPQPNDAEGHEAEALRPLRLQEAGYLAATSPPFEPRPPPWPNCTGGTPADWVNSSTRNSHTATF